MQSDKKMNVQFKGHGLVQVSRSEREWKREEKWVKQKEKENIIFKDLLEDSRHNADAQIKPENCEMKQEVKGVKGKARERKERNTAKYR